MAFTYENFYGDLIDTNGYLVMDKATGDAILIDAPWGVADEVVAAAERNGVTIRAIVLTHAHWDHVGSATELSELTGAEILAHPKAVDRLAAPSSSMMELPFKIRPVVADRFLDEGDEVRVGGSRFDVYYLPGHDPAHIVLHSPEEIAFFGGDVVFPNGHGRTDIPGASEADMKVTLKRVAGLPPETIVYPGHGVTTTIGEEPWLRWYMRD